MGTTRWLGGVLGAAAAAAIIVSCGGTGGGGGSKGNPTQQFVLNSNNTARLILNVSPNTVDANKSDRIGLVALLTDPTGRGISGVTITFTSDVDDVDPTTPGDITFIPNQVDNAGQNFGQAVTDASGRADIIAVAGVDPTGTGDIVGTGAFFAEPPPPFGLRAQMPITLYDVGFIDTPDGVLDVIPSGATLVEPAPGDVVFFNIVGGTPPYLLKNEVTNIGAATLGQHCLPGCTENGGIFCVGSPCQKDADCNLNASPTPANVCSAPVKRCLASCRGTNCAGSRCATDADCNDGSATPADVCKDAGQGLVFVINANPQDGTDSFIVEDSQGGSVAVEVSASFVCGNGVARGNEQCDLNSINATVCASFGLEPGCSSQQVITGFCADLGITVPTSSSIDCADCQLTMNCEGPTGGGGPTPGGGATFTPGGGIATPSPTATPGPTSTAGGASTLVLALIANRSGDNGNGTFTNVMSATVSGSNGNPVPDGTVVSFSIDTPTQGALISTTSATNTDPPCDVTDFQQDTGTQVLNQPGVAHACLTYPGAAVGNNVTVHGIIGGINIPFTFPLPDQAP